MQLSEACRILISTFIEDENFAYYLLLNEQFSSFIPENFAWRTLFFYFFVKKEIKFNREVKKQRKVASEGGKKRMRHKKRQKFFHVLNKMPFRERSLKKIYKIVTEEKFHVIKLHFPVNRNVLHFFLSLLLILRSSLCLCAKEMH